jgi:hypothetical protein
MGIKDKAKELREKVTESGKAEEYIDKAREKLSSATGHRADDKIDQGAEKAKGATGERQTDAGNADNPADG